MSFERTKYCGHDAIKFVLHDENGTKYTVVCPGTDEVILAGYALTKHYVLTSQMKEQTGNVSR